MKASELIYDWNQVQPPALRTPDAVLLNDESLRDGLQSPSVRDPSVEEKIHILHLMEALGINSLDLGLPGAGSRATEHVEALARAIVICDTAGHVTPMGAYALVTFVVNEVVKPSGEKIRVDWHGHCDRGLAVANAMAALIAGADCVHACALGIGERVGNTQMDQMLVNLKLMKVAPWENQDLTKLKEYCEAVSRATGVPIPPNYPVVGEDAFRTATGVHAAAVIKAYKKNDTELADAVYSGVPAKLFGLEQIIDVGPMSGKSNVLFWLERHGIPADDAAVERIYKRAKASDHTLSEAEIMACVETAKPR